MKAKSNHAVRFFALCLAILLVCSVLIWGLASNWGKVDIKRITITGDDGSLISSLVYVPETATNENPAQVVMIFHGRSNHAHSNDTWSMELARRGYVVFSPDLSGGGQSDVNDRQAQAIALTKYVTTLNYVDCSNMTLVGYSAGCGTTAQVAMALPEYIKNVVQVMSPMLIHEINIDTPSTGASSRARPTSTTTSLWATWKPAVSGSPSTSTCLRPWSTTRTMWWTRAPCATTWPPTSPSTRPPTCPPIPSSTWWTTSPTSIPLTPTPLPMTIWCGAGIRSSPAWPV